MPIQIHKSVHGQFFVRVTAKNGRTITSSETLKTKKNAYKNANALITALGLRGEAKKIQDKTI